MASSPRTILATVTCALAAAAGVGAESGCSATDDAEPSPTSGGTTTTTGAGAGGSASSAGGGATTSTSGVGGSFTGSGGGSVQVPTDVQVVITADNAYGFGYGDASSMANYFGGVEAVTAGQIFNCGDGPETYLVPAADAAAGNYLYIVAYADKATTQGVLGQFRRIEAGGSGGGGGAGGGAESGEAVYTGTADWEVCATGQDYSPGSGGPNLATINAAIPGCTWFDSTGDANGKMQIGEDNTTPRTSPEVGNEFPLTCGIDEEARWMWFNWSPATLDWPNTGSPFIWPGGTDNPDGQFLIFRLGAEDVPPPIPR